jgi:hypothetical protein
MRHETPLVARSRNVTNPVEDRPQIVFTMGTVRAAQQQIRQHKRPLFIRDITRIPNPIPSPHPSMLDKKQSYAKNLARCKLHNRL